MSRTNFRRAFFPFAPGEAGFTRADLAGLFTDLAIFYASIGLGAVPGRAQLGSFVLGTLVGFAIKANRAQIGVASVPGWSRWGAGVLVAVGAFFLRGGLLASLTQLLHLRTEIAIVLPALLSSAVNAVGGTLFVFADKGDTLTREATWPRVAAALIAYAVLLRLCYLGLPEILYEEGYYWNYAQHLDLGYLDHPPMIAWVIWFFTTIAGDSEFALRLGAFVSWFVGAYYCYKLTKRIFDSKTAADSVLLHAILPIYFAVSLVMFPDSILVACWSGALYFLYRFLIEEERKAFLGVGILFGIGLLTKYTIGLLGLAALLFLVTDRRARRLLLRPEPYLAILVAALLFSPAVVWNARNDWVSFVYQGAGRVAGGHTFALHKLIGAVLVLITPVGLMAAIAIFRSKKPFLPQTAEGADRAERTYRLLLLSAGVPLAVFLTASVFRQTKLNWTGPLWLALLPYMARLMSPLTERFRGRLSVFGRRPWAVTAVALVLFYGGALYYLTVGLPGIRYPVDLLGLGWREISSQVEGIAGEIETQTGERPLVVGMDVNRISSWLAFYRGRTNPRSTGRRTNSGALETGGRHLFGQESYMYRYWFPTRDEHHKTLVLVGREPDDLTGRRVGEAIAQGGDVHAITAEKNGQVVRRVYYRIVRLHRNPLEAVPQPAASPTRKTD